MEIRYFIFFSEVYLSLQFEPCMVANIYVTLVRISWQVRTHEEQRDHISKQEAREAGVSVPF
jgi:hypothetical protein